MVYAIRDPVTSKKKTKRKGSMVDGEEVEVDDPGEPDKRLLCIEEEYCGVIRTMLERNGNTLSQRIREAWQGRPIGSMTKNTQTRCKEPHISIIGHVTVEELVHYLTTREIANGFGNRHLWFCVKRSKMLPDGGGEYTPSANLVADLKAAIDRGRTRGELRRDSDARELWHELYPELSEGKPGLAGAMMGRAEANVMRLAVLYAVLDCSACVTFDHLKAALAVWTYSAASVYYIFGNSTGDEVADQILRELKQCPDGKTRTDISGFLGRNQSASRIDKALNCLLQGGLAEMVKVKTPGRPVEKWYEKRPK